MRGGRPRYTPHVGALAVIGTQCAIFPQSLGSLLGESRTIIGAFANSVVLRPPTRLITLPHAFPHTPTTRAAAPLAALRAIMPYQTILRTVFSTTGRFAYTANGHAAGSVVARATRNLSAAVSPTSPQVCNVAHAVPSQPPQALPPTTDAVCLPASSQRPARCLLQLGCCLCVRHPGKPPLLTCKGWMQRQNQASGTLCAAHKLFFT
jgi:hypothetical protein